MLNCAQNPESPSQAGPPCSLACRGACGRVRSCGAEGRGRVRAAQHAAADEACVHGNALQHFCAVGGACTCRAPAMLRSCSTFSCCGEVMACARLRADGFFFSQ